MSLGHPQWDMWRNGCDSTLQFGVTYGESEKGGGGRAGWGPGPQGFWPEQLEGWSCSSLEEKQVWEEEAGIWVLRCLLDI